MITFFKSLSKNFSQKTMYYRSSYYYSEKILSSQHKKAIQEFQKCQRQALRNPTLLESQLLSMKSAQNEELYSYLQTVPEQQIEKTCQKSQYLLARILSIMKTTKNPKLQILLNKYSNKFQHLSSQYFNRYLFQRGLLQQKQPILQNWLYYSGQSIQQLHLRKGDYYWLQRNHDYIQYMFPNHYQSRFNYQASPLSYYEASLFLNQKHIALKMYKSIRIFFDFMGLNISPPPNEQINIINQDRLCNVLLVNWHNHLRLRRILACLSVTGFRHIALKLINFLNDLIKSSARFKRLQHQLEQWDKYGQYDLKEALQLCFHAGPNFPKQNRCYEQIQEIMKIDAEFNEQNNVGRNEVQQNNDQESYSNDSEDLMSNLNDHQQSLQKYQQKNQGTINLQNQTNNHENNQKQKNTIQPQNHEITQSNKNTNKNNQ